MPDCRDLIRKCAASVADATIAAVLEDLDRDWEQLPYPRIGRRFFLDKVLSEVLSEISSEDGEQLKGTEILEELRRQGGISSPGIVSDHAKHTLKIADTVIFLYRKKRRTRLRVDDPWPVAAFAEVHELDFDNPKGCSAKVFVDTMKAFASSCHMIFCEYWRAEVFYENSICPKIEKLLELKSVTDAALKK